MFSKLKSFISKCTRVFKITKKPGASEFKAVVKVSGLGILAVGAIGFVIHILWTFML